MLLLIAWLLFLRLLSFQSLQTRIYFSHIRRSSSIRKVQGTVYDIEIRYKCPVNNTKQDSERNTQNFFWRAQTILDMGQNSGKNQFCLFLSKLCRHICSQICLEYNMFFVCLIWDSPNGCLCSNPQFP